MSSDPQPKENAAKGDPVALNDWEHRMNPSAPFIGRPVATTLLTIAIAIAGLFAFLRLPVALMPQVDYPTILVTASMPGASPNTMAATVATPLERHLGIIADDAASRIMQQGLSQIEGVGQVQIGGSSLPAVRVELNPLALFKYGIGLENVRAALASANAHSPKGAIEDGDRRLQIYTNDKASHAEDYRPLVIAYRDGAAVRLSDVAEVEDSVENVRAIGLANGKPAVVVILRRQPGANIIDTVERVKAVLPQLEASIPRAIDVELILDRTTTIRSSLHEVERTLVIAVCLVVLVVFAFLRSLRAALIPTIA